MFEGSSASLSPMAPPDGPDPSAFNETLFSSDRRFAVHGEVAMLLVTIIFFLFLFLLLVRLFLRRRYLNKSPAYDSESGSGTDGFKGRTDPESPAAVKPPS